MAEKEPNFVPNVKISLEEYLEEVARFCENEYGSRFRGQFQDMEGTSELAMLAAPTAVELKELRRAVAIMTAAEKHNAETLSDVAVALETRGLQTDVWPERRRRLLPDAGRTWRLMVRCRELVYARWVAAAAGLDTWSERQAGEDAGPSSCET